MKSHRRIPCDFTTNVVLKFAGSKKLQAVCYCVTQYFLLLVNVS